MTEENQYNRLTAYKVRISHLLNAEYVKPEGEWTPSYIKIKDNKISRVNVIATVIAKYENDDGSYVSLTLDDGTSSIQTKSWKEDTKSLKGIEIGDLILTIAKIRNYNGENYLSPEIVKPLQELMWLELRKKELNKIYGPILETDTVPKKSEKFSSDQRQTIIKLVEELNSDDGADISEVISKSKMQEVDANRLIQELLKEGEIFEIRPGGLKIIS